MPDLDLNSVSKPLRELIADLAPGESVTIVDQQRPIAVVSPLPQAVPQFGGCRGMLTIVSEDNVHLDDFVEHMP